MSEALREDNDNPWKIAMEFSLPDFVGFFHPKLYALIDWSRGFDFLDSELRQIAHDAEVGTRHVDKLVKVWMKDGSEYWILIHIELQAQKDDEFPERIFIYFYRIYDRFRRPIVSLAILADDNEQWHPTFYERELCDCKVRLDFPTVKLLDYKNKWDELDQSTNPFAVLVMAHLKTQETRQNYDLRMISKLDLVRRMNAKGFTVEVLRNLFRVIDWLMVLPDNLKKEFGTKLNVMKETEHMPFVDCLEEMYTQQGMEKGEAKGMEKGKAEALRDLVLINLAKRFGMIPADIMDRLKATHDLPQLQRLVEQSFFAASLPEFAAQL